MSNTIFTAEIPTAAAVILGIVFLLSALHFAKKAVRQLSRGGLRGATSALVITAIAAAGFFDLGGYASGIAGDFLA